MGFTGWWMPVHENRYHNREALVRGPPSVHVEQTDEDGTKRWRRVERIWDPKTARFRIGFDHAGKHTVRLEFNWAPPVVLREVELPAEGLTLKPVTLATGFAAGGFSQSLPNSMKADVIDLDTAQSRENRAALFFSAWSFAQKATASIGAAIAMYGLALFGFDAAPEAVNGPEELFGLRFLFSSFPSLFFLTGAAIVWNYPITEERHAEIRREIEAGALESGAS